MRILHITSEYPPVHDGGLAAAVAGLINASLRTHMNIKIIHIKEVSGKNYQKAAMFYQSNKNLITLRPIEIEMQISNATGMCIHLIKQWKPDIIHIHTYSLYPIAQAIKKQLAIPIVYTIYTLEREEREENFDKAPLESLMRSIIQEGLVRLADRLIVLSQIDRELLVKYCPDVSNKIRVVGLGINTDIKQNKKKFKSKTNKILYVGRLVKRKGILDLIKSIPGVLEQVPNTHFIIIGGREYENSVELEQKWVPSTLHPFRKYITFTGWVSSRLLDELYGYADILVVPSWYEPFGLVILEAMYRGVPVVASNAGGPREILNHGETGIIFPARNVDALSNALILLLKNPPLRRRMAFAALKEVRRKWLWSKVIKNIKIIYDELYQ